MSKNLTEQTEIDTTGLKPVHEGFSGLTTANSQNSQTNTHNNSQEKGFSGIVSANSQNTTNDTSQNNNQSDS